MELWYDMDACSKPQQEGTEIDTILSAVLGKCSLYHTVTLKRKTNITVRHEIRDWGRIQDSQWVCYPNKSLNKDLI